jgi:hypothetical protein
MEQARLTQFAKVVAFDANRYDLALNMIYYGINYLKTYGYLQNFKYTIDDFKTRVKLFQEMFNITLDGEIGPETLSSMSLKRCGCPDIPFANTQSIKWNKEVKYFVEDAPTIDGIKANKAAFEEIIRLSFKAWQEVCCFPKTIQVTSKSAANYYFDTRTGRSNDFDGPSGVLAYNTLGMANPSISFYDGDENFTFEKSGGIKLLHVCTHELGHGLDLDHSRVRTALMAPTYSPTVGKPQQNDDISRALKLYGQPCGTASPNPTPDPDPTPDPTPDPVPTPDPSNPKGKKLIIEFDNVLSAQLDGYRISKMS